MQIMAILLYYLIQEIYMTKESNSRAKEITGLHKQIYNQWFSTSHLLLISILYISFWLQPFSLIIDISCSGISAEQTQKLKLQTWPAVIIHMNLTQSQLNFGKHSLIMHNLLSCFSSSTIKLRVKDEDPSSWNIQLLGNLRESSWRCEIYLHQSYSLIIDTEFHDYSRKLI